MEKQTIRIENKSPFELPTYSDSGASGFDLRADLSFDCEEWENGGNQEWGGFKNGYFYITLQPLERKMIHTGIYLELPENTELQVRPKSGQAIKRGLSVINTP